MSSELAQALAVVERSIGMEQEGHHFYTKAAERTSDVRGREMFQALAQDELAHLRALQSHYVSLQETGTWNPQAIGPAKDRSRDEFTLFPHRSEDVQEAIDIRAGDLDALRFGIEIEHKSYSFYDGLAQTATEPAARALFQRLALEEEGHRRLLQNTYDYLADPGAWFQQQEKPIFEG